MSTNLPEKIDLRMVKDHATTITLITIIERYNQLLDYLAEREKTNTGNPCTGNPCTHAPSHFPHNMITCDDQRTTKL